MDSPGGSRARSHEPEAFSTPKRTRPFYPTADCRIPLIEDAEIHNKTYRHGDKLIVTCHEGYKIRYPDLYNLVSLCRDDGTWDNLPICQGTRWELWSSAVPLPGCCNEGAPVAQPYAPRSPSSALGIVPSLPGVCSSSVPPVFVLFVLICFYWFRRGSDG